MKYWIFFISLIFIVSSQNAYAFLFDKNNPNKHTTSVVIDYNSGQIIVDKNKDKKMYPASLTKLMTLYLLFEKIDNKEIKFTDDIFISRKAADQPASKLGLPAGSKIKVKDAILSVIIKSNNDIAYAIAEHVSNNNYKQFIESMNTKAKELGLNNTHYVNANGLHNKNQFTTAYDVAKLSRALMIHYNSYYVLFSIPSFHWKKRTYSSTDHLLSYNGIDGIKTGYTRKSGFNLATSAQSGNTRIIAVTMGFPSYQNRDTYMKNLIDESLELAYNNHMYSVSYTEKPEALKNMSENSIQYVKNTKENSNNTSNITYHSNNKYTIKRISQIFKVINADFITIAPYVKGHKRYSKIKKHYAVQVGAFSSYSKALTTAYNALLIKGHSSYLKKKYVTVNKKNHYYLARFTHLTKTQANQACNSLRKKKQECFVILTT